MKIEDNLKLQLKNTLRFWQVPTSLTISKQIYIWQQFHLAALTYFSNFSHLNIILTKEKDMAGSELIKFLLMDIVNSGEYTLEGVATYTGIPVDLLIDIIAELNINPSFEVSTKIMYLHTTVRRKVYEDLQNQRIQQLNQSIEAEFSQLKVDKKIPAKNNYNKIKKKMIA